MASSPEAGGSLTAGPRAPFVDYPDGSVFYSSFFLACASRRYCIFSLNSFLSSELILVSSVSKKLTWRVLTKKMTAELLKNSGLDEL